MSFLAGPKGPKGATLNKNFMIDPTAKFRPAEAESVADGGIA